MSFIGIKNPKASLTDYGILNPSNEYWNLNPEEWMELTIKKDLGVLSDTGALTVNTGKFTGRAPNDRFIVKDDITADTVDWNAINMPFSPVDFDCLYDDVTDYLQNKDLFIKDGYACANEDYRLDIRVISTLPWSALFANNMFLRPERSEFPDFDPEWVIIQAPDFKATPSKHHTPRENFAIINFTRKRILIGGTGYTGEIKKGIFSVLNYILPQQQNVLSMHCSANVGEAGDAAVYFGLSGTGKTTLSADPNRFLIGDDEHGWGKDGVFNFEGGCYAKTIDLSAVKEPDIYKAIRHGAMLENIIFFEGTRTPNYEDISITQNTRVSYPIYHIDKIQPSCQGPHPKNVFFLTADAFGVLPPISKLTKEQAMYYFISGYTAKVAGTEEGITEPVATFSAVFGAPFMPLHPTQYAEMLAERMEAHGANVWLINTGWVAGPYGTGYRINLPYTRAMVSAALDGALNQVAYDTLDVFDLRIPTSCPGVPSDLLNPRLSWDDRAAYDQQARKLASLFIDNFKQFEDKAEAKLVQAGPRI